MLAGDCAVAIGKDAALTTHAREPVDLIKQVKIRLHFLANLSVKPTISNPHIGLFTRPTSQVSLMRTEGVLSLKGWRLFPPKCSCEFFECFGRSPAPRPRCRHSAAGRIAVSLRPMPPLRLSGNKLVWEMAKALT